MRKNPALGTIKKTADFEGDGNMVIPVIYGDQLGVAPTFADAQTLASAVLQTKFTITRADLYGSGNIDGKLIRATKTDKGSFERSLRREMDALVQRWTRMMSLMIWSAGGGAAGQIKTGTSPTTTVTLADPTQSTWFQKGQRIQVSSTNGTSGSLRDSGDYVTITGVDRTAGTLTVDSDITVTINGTIAGDYLFIYGFFGQSNTLFKGIPAWVPTAAPGATSFFGVDRTTDSMLGGLRYSADSGGPIEQSLMNAAALCLQEGASPDVIFLNPIDLGNMITALQSKNGLRTGTVQGKQLTVGYPSVKVSTVAGELDCMADPGVPKGYAWILDSSTWEIHYMGSAFPHWIQEDDKILFRSATTDSYEFRAVATGQLACRAPGHNCAVTL